MTHQRCPLCGYEPTFKDDGFTCPNLNCYMSKLVLTIDQWNHRPIAETLIAMIIDLRFYLAMAQKRRP